MWDDGLVTDLKLIEILYKFNVTACFAISPSRHKKTRKKNDHRGDYGEIVSLSELKEFSNFEICNHTNNHIDLNKVDRDVAYSEIMEGNKKLEDIFERKIKGFCYPYGVYTNASISILKEHNFLYARTTLKKDNIVENNLLLKTTGKWNEFELNELMNLDKKIILWGHTYEIKNKKDWDRIEDMYYFFAKHPDIKIISFEEMVKKTCLY